MEAERRENREYLVMFGEDEDVKSPRTLRALDRVKRSAKRVAADAAYQRAVETKMRSLMRAHDFDVENLTFSYSDFPSGQPCESQDLRVAFSKQM